MKNKFIAFIFSLLFVLTAGATDNVINGVGIEDRIGNRLPVDTEVVDENGGRETIADLLAGKPALLSFASFRCENLCGLVTAGIADAVRHTGLAPGRDFRLLTISLTPTDTPDLALMKKRAALARLGLTGDRHPGWHFLVARPESVAALATAAGVRFRENNRHPAALLVISPSGKLSRVFSGITYAPSQIKDAIAEAGRERTRKSLGAFILNCLPSRVFESQQGLWITAALRWLSLATVAGLGVLFFILIRRPKEQR